MEKKVLDLCGFCCVFSSYDVPEGGLFELDKTNLVAMCDFCLMQHFKATGVKEHERIREILPGVQSEWFFFYFFNGSVCSTDYWHV